jgi:hypothetical protein
VVEVSLIESREGEYGFIEFALVEEFASLRVVEEFLYSIQDE